MYHLARLFAIYLLFLTTPALAATIYIDFDEGDDANAGTSVETAFKHCPGDRNATGNAKSMQLQPGDVVKFKGGVTYRGMIEIRQSGEPGKPIVYDGNLDNTYGQGKAIINGSMPVTDLKPAQSADEVFGNPNWQKIFIGYLPADSYWNNVGLCQGDTLLPVSQIPNSPDPIFQEDPRYYHQTERQPPVTHTDFEVRYLSPLDENETRPLIAMFDGSRNSAVIERFDISPQVEVTLPRPITVRSLAMTPARGYASPKRVTFHGDGKLILDTEFAKPGDRPVEQLVDLDQPATFSRLVITFHNAHPNDQGRQQNWGAVTTIAGYDEQGNNLLLTKRTTTLTHAFFDQQQQDYWDGAYLAIYARPAMVYYKKVLGYDPSNHTVTIETLAHSEKPYNPGSAFSMLNSPRIIDMPGEYSVNVAPEPDGTHKLYIWPIRLKEDGQPDDLTYANVSTGFELNRVSHVTIQGFMIKKQGGNRGSTGINARGPASDVIIRHNTVTGLRGRNAAIHSSQVNNLLVDHCQVVDNAGHTKGILLRNGENIITRNCLLQKNSSTALDYYTVHNGAVQNNTVIDNRGMHANGLTFYVGCSDILIENNFVARGNVALTLQHGENMIIRNNILSGNRAIGLWAGRAYDNIVITNNILLLEGETDGDNGAIYGGNPSSKNYTIANNIIDGLSGNVLLKSEIHHNIFTQIGPVQSPDNLGDNIYFPDKNSLFTDWQSEKYQLRPNSPAIDRGIALGGINRYDRKGFDRTKTSPPDIGPYEFTAEMMSANEVSPQEFRFTFDQYRIKPPTYTPLPGYRSIFQQDPNGTPISVRGMDYVEQQGGHLNIRKSEGWILNWDNTGHAVSWNITAPKAGAYELVIRFASEVPSVRSYAINGQAIAGLEQVRLKATGGWTIWEKAAMDMPVYLKKGSNTLTITNIKNSLNIREIVFVPLADDQPIEPHRVVE